MKEYLGDGLYAEFDGYGIRLSAPRENGEHWVYLEPEVYAALLAFVERIKRECQPQATVGETASVDEL